MSSSRSDVSDRDSSRGNSGSDDNSSYNCSDSSGSEDDSSSCLVSDDAVNYDDVEINTIGVDVDVLNNEVDADGDLEEFSDNQHNDYDCFPAPTYRPLAAFDMIVSTFPSSHTIDWFRTTYNIPVEYEIVFPGPDQRVHQPPPQCMTVFLGNFQAGLRFPIAPEVDMILRTFPINPSQLTPNSYAAIVSFIIVMKKLGFSCAPLAFWRLFCLKYNHSGGDKGFHYVCARRGHVFLVEYRGNYGAGWKNKFLFIKEKSPNEFEYAREWIDNKKSPPRPRLSTLSSLDIEKLRRNVYKVNTLLSDDILSASGLSPAAHEGEATLGEMVGTRSETLSTVWEEIKAKKAAVKQGRKVGSKNQGGDKSSGTSRASGNSTVDVVDADSLVGVKPTANVSLTAAPIAERSSSHSVKLVKQGQSVDNLVQVVGDVSAVNVEKVPHQPATWLKRDKLPTGSAKVGGKRRATSSKEETARGKRSANSTRTTDDFVSLPEGIPLLSEQAGIYHLNDTAAERAMRNLWSGLNREEYYERLGDTPLERSDRLLREMRSSFVRAGTVVDTMSWKFKTFATEKETFDKQLADKHALYVQAEQESRLAMKTVNEQKELTLQAQHDAAKANEDCKKATEDAVRARAEIETLKKKLQSEIERVGRRDDTIGKWQNSNTTLKAEVASLKEKMLVNSEAAEQAGYQRALSEGFNVEQELSVLKEFFKSGTWTKIASYRGAGDMACGYGKALKHVDARGAFQPGFTVASFKMEDKTPDRDDSMLPKVSVEASPDRFASLLDDWSIWMSDLMEHFDIEVDYEEELVVDGVNKKNGVASDVHASGVVDHSNLTDEHLQLTSGPVAEQILAENGLRRRRDEAGAEEHVQIQALDGVKDSLVGEDEGAT